MISLIGLDWGSSHLRAYAFDAQGRVVDKRSSAAGAMTLRSPEAFREALREVVDHDDNWREVPRIACGMVGARGAWIEAGYCDLGAGVERIAEKAVAIEIAGSLPLWVIPGIASPAPDVMRGEETQLIGSGITDGLVVLPGTHSKWATLAAGAIISFTTFLTGEINNLIRSQSSVGRVLAPNARCSDSALERGIALAKTQSSWLTALFSFRARAVAHNVDAQTLSDEFSAWLIASELIAACTNTGDIGEISIIGAESLSQWYEAVATRLGLRAKLINADQCVTAGLWQIARAKSLV